MKENVDKNKSMESDIIGIKMRNKVGRKKTILCFGIHDPFKRIGAIFVICALLIFLIWILSLSYVGMFSEKGRLMLNFVGIKNIQEDYISNPNKYKEMNCQQVSYLDAEYCLERYHAIKSYVTKTRSENINTILSMLYVPEVGLEEFNKPIFLSVTVRYQKFKLEDQMKNRITAYLMRSHKHLTLDEIESQSQKTVKNLKEYTLLSEGNWSKPEVLNFKTSAVWGEQNFFYASKNELIGLIEYSNRNPNWKHSFEVTYALNDISSEVSFSFYTNEDIESPIDFISKVVFEIEYFLKVSKVD